VFVFLISIGVWSQTKKNLQSRIWGILSRIWVFHEQTKKQKVGSLGAESAKHCS